MLASSFIGKEAEENAVTLDSEVDHEDAFNMFVEFLYTSSYLPPEGYDIAAKAILHARVYVLAERLCMQDVKEMAFVQMTTTLVKSYPSQYSHAFRYIPPGKNMFLVAFILSPSLKSIQTPDSGRQS